MSRTTEAAVKGILVEHYDSINTPSLAPFIASASSLVDYVQTKDTNSILSSSSREVIERWLAAHFYAHADQLLQSKNTSRAGGTFQGRTDLGLNSTQYGQTAMILDVSGTLAALNQQAKEGKKVAGGAWLGTYYGPISYNDYTDN